MGAQAKAAFYVVLTFGILMGAWATFRWAMITRLRDSFEDAWGAGDCGLRAYASQLLRKARTPVPEIYVDDGDDKTGKKLEKAYCIESDAVSNSLMLFLTLTLLYWMLQALRMQWKTYLHYPAGIKAKETSTVRRQTALYLILFGLIIFNSTYVFSTAVQKTGTWGGFGITFAVWLVLATVWIFNKNRGMDIDKEKLIDFLGKNSSNQYEELKKEIKTLHDTKDVKTWRTTMAKIYEYQEYMTNEKWKTHRIKVHRSKGANSTTFTRFKATLQNKVFSLPTEDYDGYRAYRNLMLLFLIMAAVSLRTSGMQAKSTQGLLGICIVFAIMAVLQYHPLPADTSKSSTLSGKIDLREPLKLPAAYHEVSPMWVNGAWLNFWRLVVVSSAFHFIALSLSKNTQLPVFSVPTDSDTSSTSTTKPAECGTIPSGFTPQDVSNADQCATYMVLEQLNMLGSLICTFILFAILMYGGYVYHPQKGRAGPLFHRLCKDTIGTEDVRIPGEWWNIVSNTKTWWALFMYVVVFAGLGHGTAVVYVHAKQKKLLRDTAVYRSYVMTNMKRGGDPPASTKKEQQQSIIEYAMYNDLFNNFIMIILLVFLVNYVKDKFATPAATKASDASSVVGAISDTSSVVDAGTKA